MKKFPIAESGIMVTPLGLGTVKLGRNQGVKYPTPFNIPDDKASADLIAHAKALGINLIDTALQRLNTDYIDIMLVHSDGNDLHIINHYGILDVLADLKKQGLIRAFGMSTKTVAGGLLAAKQSDVVMVSYNIEYTEEESVIDYCRAHHKGVLLKKAFGSGHLCFNKDKTSIQDNINFLFSKTGVTSIIVGTINPQHLAENVLAVNTAIS